MNNIIILPNQKTNTKWTPYLATAYAEGFCEGENANIEEQVEAFAALTISGIYRQLQGSFGRTIENLILNNVLNKKGEINWENIKNLNNYIV